MSYPGLKSLLDYFKRTGKQAKRHRVACICSVQHASELLPACTNRREFCG